MSDLVLENPIGFLRFILLDLARKVSIEYKPRFVIYFFSSKSLTYDTESVTRPKQKVHNEHIYTS